MQTTLSSRLSQEQIEQYHELGYCVAYDLFSETEIQEIEDFFEEYQRTGGYTGQGHRHLAELDKTKVQVRAMHPHRHDKKAERWMMQPNVCDALESLLGCAPLGAQTMYYYKPPGARGQGMHQDNFYLMATPATCIAAWTAIDGADNDNGCLWVVPRSHKSPILCPEKDAGRWMNYGDSHISKFPRDEKPVCVPVPRGGTMFFSGNLIHGSGPNRTPDRSRRTFIGHYVNCASEELSQFYHPVLNRDGEVVSTIQAVKKGGPCGDNWQGGVH
ncbi:MAG: phytanoyl-CoA dioxygenase family protein [Candidatus Methylacidiphilales bacterium]|nr:phytanoyl-CoA dioxygenase family protein [Candidatus Methylacidiphilales bacterium]